MTRRRFQFRLRTLLLVVALVAAACTIAKLTIENRGLIRELKEADANAQNAMIAKDEEHLAKMAALKRLAAAEAALKAQKVESAGTR
jgi:hypothetical protein